MSPSQRCDEILRLIDETIGEGPSPTTEAGVTAPQAPVGPPWPPQR